MKNLLTLLIGMLLSITGSSQSCLPQGITFSTQLQIDNFQINYPNCSQIEGAVTINGSNITNLNGLNTITSIGGGLFVDNCQNLTSLTGLDNLTSIDSSLRITHNTFSFSLTGLNNLTYIGNDLMLNIYHLDDLSDLANLSYIGGDLALDCYHLGSPAGLNSLDSIGGSLILGQHLGQFNLAGLENITYIGGSLLISSSFELTSLTGLDNLCTIGGDLVIYDWYNMFNLFGLNNLTTIGGSIQSNNNMALHNLAGLEKVTSLGGISMSYCSHLTDLTSLSNVTSIGNSVYIGNCGALNSLAGLNNVTSIGGSLTIKSCLSLNQLTGLDNVTSVAGSLTIIDMQLNNFNNLTGLDNVTSIGGHLIIKENGIHDLNGLNNLSSIGGSLQISRCDSLTSLSGLYNLTTIGASFQISDCELLTSQTGLNNLSSIGGSLQISRCDSLTSLTGLDNLTTIGASFQISDCLSLTSLTGLDNLTSLGGSLAISNCNSLISLTGLDNINPGSITDLYICYNDHLSDCKLKSICDYLLRPDGTSVISKNATGCNSKQEVEEACATSICLVSVDSLTRKNVIVWYKPPSASIDHFNIYSEGVQVNQYLLTGSVPYDSLSIFIDYNSTPSQQSYRYKISAVDTSGAEVATSEPHQTIHLTISQGIGNSYHLLWSNYEGFFYDSCKIYRGTTPSNLSYLTILSSTNNSYTDLTPPSGFVYYQIEVLSPAPCIPTKAISYNSTKSNIASNNPEGLFEKGKSHALYLYPNPASGLLSVQVLDNVHIAEAFLELISMDGQVMKRQCIKGNKSQIDISSLQKGIYMVKVIGEIGVQVGKFIKQ